MGFCWLHQFCSDKNWKHIISLIQWHSAKRLWCSQLKYEDCQHFVIDTATENFSQSAHCENIITSYYVSQWTLRSVMMPWFHSEVAWDSSGCQTAVGGSHGRAQYYPALGKLLMFPLLDPRGHTAFRAPLLLITTYLTVLCVLVDSRAVWFIIQINGICIITNPLFTVCCIWADTVCPNGPFTNVYLHQGYYQMKKCYNCKRAKWLSISNFGFSSGKFFGFMFSSQEKINFVLTFWRSWNVGDL